MISAPERRIALGTSRRSQSTHRGPPASVLVAWGLFATTIALEVVAIVRASPGWLVKRAPDDAFYYLEVGRRLAEGDGSTFDGIYETNGYHPLWQAVVALQWLVGPDGDGAIRTLFLIGLACTVSAVLLVARLAARVVGPEAAAVGAVLAVSGGLAGWVNGMEGPVVLLTLALVATALAAWAEQPSPWRGVVVGTACGVTVLARLDLAAVIWLVPVSMVWRARAWRPALAALAGIAAVGVPLGAAWLVRWGHPLTTSATVKSDLMRRSYEERFGGRATTGYARFLAETARSYLGALLSRFRPSSAGGLARSLLLALALWGALASARDRRSRRTTAPPWRDRAATWSPAGYALVVVLVVIVAKAVVDLISAPLWASDWYAAPQQLALLFTVGAGAAMGVRALAVRVPLAARPAAVLLAILLLPGTLRTAFQTDQVPRIAGRWQDELDLAAAWIIAEGPAGRYGANDAGLLGFRLHGSRTLVNLDGLVNDYEFAELLAEGATTVERLRAREIDVFVNRLSEEDVERELSCAEVLWRSDDPVPAGNAFDPGSDQFVYVLQVRDC